MRVRRKLVGGAGGECQAGGTSPGDLQSAERRGQETLAERVNADYRGGVTCLYDTQLLGTCLHASESGGRYRPEREFGNLSGLDKFAEIVTITGRRHFKFNQGGGQR